MQLIYEETVIGGSKSRAAGLHTSVAAAGSSKQPLKLQQTMDPAKVVALHG